MITKRNQVAIKQYAYTHRVSHRMEQALEILENVLPMLGPQSTSRVMINRIGIILLQERVTIVAPSCPDYSHSNGTYDFSTVGGGLPLLSQLHIAFLKTIVPAIPHAHCEIVVADQEAEDAVLCKRVGQTRETFLDMIYTSIQTTKEHLSGTNWNVTAMTQRFPSLQRLEVIIAKEIAHDSSLQSRLRSDTIARSGMYQKLGVFSFDEMLQRTIRTASQYCALAQIASQHKILICNHETVNLGWYNRYGAAVLHNPISVY